MPRVADIYQRPAGIDGIPNATIESADYNLNVADVEADLNLPRPIVAGGTGASNDTQARANLKTEVSAQQVTNYDTHVFEAGSFYSNPGATGEPVAGKYTSGICHFVGANVSMVLEATVYDGTGPATLIGKYTRVKWSVWGTWVKEADEYVNVTGDTMTGNLSITKNYPVVSLNKTTTSRTEFAGLTNGVQRWAILPGDASPESTSNLGSDFAIIRHNDAGAQLDTPFFIKRSTGVSTFANGTASTSFTTGAVVVTGGTGIGGTLNVGGNFSLAGTAAFTAGTASTSSITGAVTVSGGVGIASALNVGTTGAFGGNFAIASTLGSIPGISNTSTGLSVLASSGAALIVSRAVATAGSFNVNVDGTLIEMHRSGTMVGQISVSSTATAYQTSSDERLKEDLKSFDAGNIVDDTNVYDFAWKETGERSYGVIAQQAKDIYPAATFYNEPNDRWFIDYSKYVPVILQELKALRARVAELEGMVGVGVQPA